MFSDFGVSFEVNVSRIAAANVSECLCVSLLKEQVKALEDQQKLKPPANSHGKAK